MARFYFDVADGSRDVDVDGIELASLHEARHQAIRFLAEVIQEDTQRLWRGHDLRVEVASEDGLLVAAIVALAIDPMPAQTIERSSSPGDKVTPANERSSDGTGNDRAIERLARSAHRQERATAQALDTLAALMTSHALARTMLATSKARNRLPDAGIFRSAAWEMLLALYVSECEGRQMSVADFCDAGDCAPLIADRWMKVLERDYVVAYDCPSTMTRCVHLTDRATMKLETYFRSALARPVDQATAS